MLSSIFITGTMYAIVTPSSLRYESFPSAALSVPSGVNERGWIWYITPRVNHPGDLRASCMCAFAPSVQFAAANTTARIVPQTFLIFRLLSSPYLSSSSYRHFSFQIVPQCIFIPAIQ